MSFCCQYLAAETRISSEWRCYTNESIEISKSMKRKSRPLKWRRIPCLSHKSKVFFFLIHTAKIKQSLRLFTTMLDEHHCLAESLTDTRQTHQLCNSESNRDSLISPAVGVEWDAVSMYYAAISHFIKVMQSFIFNYWQILQFLLLWHGTWCHHFLYKSY